MRLAIGHIRSRRRGSSHSGRHTARRAVCAEIMPRIVTACQSVEADHLPTWVMIAGVYEPMVCGMRYYAAVAYRVTTISDVACTVLRNPVELHNTSLIQEDALLNIIKVVEWGWPAGPSFLYAIGSFIEASVIHDKIFFDPMRQTQRDEIRAQTIPSLLNQSTFVQSMIREDVLTVFPERSEVDQHFQNAKSKYSFDNFLIDYYHGFESFSSNNPDGEISELTNLIDLTQKAPSVLMADELIDIHMTAPDNSFISLTSPGLAAYVLGFNQEDMKMLEALIRKARGYLELTHNLGINFYPTLLAIPFQVGSVKAFNSKAKSLYETIIEKVVSIDEEAFVEDEFSRVPIPPLTQIVMSKSKDSVDGFIAEIIELRHRHRNFRRYLTDYERQWSTATTRAERIKLRNEFDNAWKALITSQERPSTRIIYTLWDILKSLTILPAIGDKLRDKGHELSIIGRAKGLHDFWAELLNSPVPQKNLEMMSNLFPRLADDKEWQLSRDLADSVNALLTKG
jgi:hypothetical protein